MTPHRSRIIEDHRCRNAISRQKRSVRDQHLPFSAQRNESDFQFVVDSPRWFQWTELSVPHRWGMTPHRSKIIEFHRCRKTFSRKDWAGENRPFSDMDLGNAVLAVRKIKTAGDRPPAVHAFPH